MLLKLTLITGEHLEYSVTENSFVIGRSQKCHVVIPHEGVSRQHVQIDVVDGDVYVTDLGSTNGVMINGEKIPPNEKTHFQLFYNLSFGAVETLQIEFESSGATMINAGVVSALSKYNTSNSTSDKLDTSVMKTPEKPSGYKPSSSKKGTSKKAQAMSRKEANENTGRIIINVIVILFLIGVGYYFVTQKNAEAPTTTEKKENKPKKANSDEYF